MDVYIRLFYFHMIKIKKSDIQFDSACLLMFRLARFLQSFQIVVTSNKDPCYRFRGSSVSKMLLRVINFADEMINMPITHLSLQEPILGVCLND